MGNLLAHYFTFPPLLPILPLLTIDNQGFPQVLPNSTSLYLMDKNLEDLLCGCFFKTLGYCFSMRNECYLIELRIQQEVLPLFLEVLS